MFLHQTITQLSSLISIVLPEKLEDLPVMLNSRDSANADNDFELYRYTPSLPAAIHSVIVFAILTAIHTVRLRQARATYFIPFTVGGLCKSHACAPNKYIISLTRTFQ